MLEGPSKDTDLIWEARMEGMAPEIDGKIYITEFAGVNEVAELPPPGNMATVEITGAQDYDLLGRVIEFEQASTRVPGLEAIRNNLVSISRRGRRVSGIVGLKPGFSQDSPEQSWPPKKRR